MGFGILFIGYLITFGSAFFSMYLFCDIIGCLVMLGGLIMLSTYHRSFRITSGATALLAVVYGVCAAMRVMGYGLSEKSGAWATFYTVLQNYILPIAALMFYASLFYAVASLASEVGLPDIAKRCRAYIAVFAVYSAAWLLFYILGDRIASASVRVYNVTASGLTLFNAVWLLMTAFLIMSCMKWIAPEEAVRAEEKGESLGILGRIGDRLDRIQAAVNTPKEKKRERSLRDELSHAEKLSEDSKKKNK